LNDATDGQAGSVTIASNLFVTGDPRSVVLRASCTTPGIAAFAHNRWAGFDALAIGNGCNAGEPLDQIWPTAAADDDRSFDCPASGCADLFVDGSIENSGSSSQGLSLEPSTACGRPLTAPRDPAVTTDADGRTRATSATVGAYELTCTR
jgi:hypothetical protein